MRARDSYAYPPRGLSRDEAARYIGISPSTYDRLVAEGRMPKPVRIGKRVIWDRLKVDDAFSAIGEETENSLDRALGLRSEGEQEKWSRIAQERGAALDHRIDPDTGVPLGGKGRRRP